MSNDAAPTTPAPPPELIHVDMSPEDMFPETPTEDGSNVPLGGGTGMNDPKDHVPLWLFRKTNELTGAEVRKLFLQTPHEALRGVLDFCSATRVTAFALLRTTSVPHVRPPIVRKILKSRVVSMIVSQLDLVPRELMEFAVAQLRAQSEALIVRERQLARIKLADEVSSHVSDVLKDGLLRTDAPFREGADYAGRRTIAVWTGDGDVTGEPEF